MLKRLVDRAGSLRGRTAFETLEPRSLMSAFEARFDPASGEGWVYREITPLRSLTA